MTSSLSDGTSPPFVSVPGIPNFRDIGGHRISPQASVREKFIYRCGEPSRVTEDGIKVLQSLGITHTYDLRSRTEISKAEAAGRKGIVDWEGAERVFVPVFEDKDYSPESIAVRYKNYATGGPEVCFA
jgi:hypothetical protein